MTRNSLVHALMLLFAAGCGSSGAGDASGVGPGRGGATADAAGDVQDVERYDATTDRIFVGGYQATSWLDLIIPCNSVGTNSTATDVMRQGSAPD